MTTRPLSTTDAVELASAWVGHRARRLGIRALIIKGPIAAQLGLRKPRGSADTDVLVEPARARELVDHLAGFGWRVRPAATAPRVVEAHSVSLVHDDWPIDLDVHSFWPGFLGDEAQIFDRLWNERIETTLAGVAVAAPGVEATALILALHTLRRPLGRDSARVDDLGELAEATRKVVPQPTGERMLGQAERLGAPQTAAPFLRLLGVEVAPDPQPSRELRLWRLKAETRGNVSAWIMELRAERGLGRARVVQRALLPGPEELRHLHPDLPPGIRGLVLGWARRWRSGVVEVPRTVRTLRSLALGRDESTAREGTTAEERLR